MIWIAPSAKDVSQETLEKKLWAAADQFRANSGLTAQQHSGPILGVNLRERLARRGIIVCRPQIIVIVGQTAETVPEDIHTLRRMRDLLLPRLLSGQITFEKN